MNIGQTALSIHKKVCQHFCHWNSEFIFCCVKHFVHRSFMTLLSYSFLCLCAFFQRCKGNGRWELLEVLHPPASCCGWCCSFLALLCWQNVSTGLKQAHVALCSGHVKLGRSLHSPLFLVMQSRCWGCFFFSCLIKLFFWRTRGVASSYMLISHFVLVPEILSYLSKGISLFLPWGSNIVAYWASLTSTKTNWGQSVSEKYHGRKWKLVFFM